MTGVTQCDSEAAGVGSTSDYDVDAVRGDFPILQQEVNGRPLVYLDNAATTQKPRAVIEAVAKYYEESNANIHRGVHTLSIRATDAYEGARVTAQRFIRASRREEIVFVRGTTEGINLIAQTLGRSTLQNGDEIIVSQMEHHSNIVPWQLLCEQTGAVLKVVPIDERGALEYDAYQKLLNDRTKIVAVGHVSNALGTVVPMKAMIEAAHRHGAIVVVDGAQAVPHLPVDVVDLDCDFYVFSGHKVFGPTGIGVMYGKWDVLNSMPPYQGGGDMIKSVSFEGTVYNDVPHKFEAGTPNIAGAVGLEAALNYVTGLGIERIARYEEELLQYATAALAANPEVRIIGTAPEKVSVISFVVDDIHAHDVGTILDQVGVAVRTGNHCAQPAVERFGVSATARASLALYNTKADVDALVAGIGEVTRVFH